MSSGKVLRHCAICKKFHASYLVDDPQHGRMQLCYKCWKAEHPSGTLVPEAAHAAGGQGDVRQFHHRRLPDFSTLLSGRVPPDETGFQSQQLQIWYNHTDKSWVGDGERPHKHLHSDECFIVLQGTLVVEIEGERFTVGPREFCCFPAGLYHAIAKVRPPVETLMIRAPSVADKVYQEAE